MSTLEILQGFCCGNNTVNTPSFSALLKFCSSICFQGTGSSEPVARKGYFWRQLSQLPAKANLLQTIPKARETCPAMSSLCKSGKRTSARRQIPQAMQNFAKPFLKRRATGKADCNLITSLVAA